MGLVNDPGGSRQPQGAGDWMKDVVAAVLAMAIAGSCIAAPRDEAAQDVWAKKVALGRQIAEENCATCHAIGRKGDSPHPLSPPFRTLSSNYELEALEEALAEGIAVGHVDMPQFEFDPGEIDSLVAYLQSVQANSTPK